MEVKLNPRRGRTEYQTIGPKGYCGFLNTPPEVPRRFFTFLVPANLKDLKEIRRDIEVFRQENSSITATVVLWEDIFAISKQLSSDPLQWEFWQMLRKDFEPMRFTAEEARVAVSGVGLPISAFNKAAYVVDRVAEQCKGEFLFGKPQYEKTGKEYGVWFYRRNKGRHWGETFFFWFGILSPYWEKTGRALCFGITNDKLAEKAAFLESYSGETEEFCDGKPQSASDVFTLGWVSEGDLIEDDPSGQEPAARIWESLRPILDKVYQAG